jgi:hypothetical protein
MRKPEPWMCPRCGLEGDHLKSPDPARCKTCCKVDAAADLFDALEAVVEAVPTGKVSIAARVALDNARAALAKARGEA